MSATVTQTVEARRPESLEKDVPRPAGLEDSDSRGGGRLLSGLGSPSAAGPSPPKQQAGDGAVSNGDADIPANQPTAGGGASASPPPTTTDDDTPRSTDGQKDLSATKIALVMAPLCLSTLLSALDLTIVTPAVPAIAASFQSVAGYIWVGSAFILAYTAITPVWGSVADIWGRRPIILLAQALFFAGSLLCALAPRMDALVVGRAVQGLGASGMSMMVNIIICDMFSLRDRALYLAVTSVVWAVGSAVGPVLGGLFTTRLDWRWCFWINLPISGVVIVVLFFYLDVPSSHTPVLAGLKAIDWSGSLLIIGGALMILLALDFGDVTFPWSSPTVICLLVFGVAVLFLFGLNEWKVASNPVIPPRLFSNRSTLAAFGVLSFNYYVFIGMTYYLPLYSQSVLGANALSSGVYLLPLIVSTSLAAAFAGVFIQRTGHYLYLMYAAQVMQLLGVGLFINLKFERDLPRLFVYQILAGVGVGLNIEGPMLAAQAAASALDTAAVIATMGFCRSIFTAVSVVVGGVIFQNEMNAAQSGLVGKIGAELAGRFGGDGASANVEFIDTLPGDQQVVVRQAYFGSLRTVWIMYVAFAGLSAVLNLFVKAHHLSRENKGAVLGVNRRLGSEPTEARESEAIGVAAPVELSGLRERSRVSAS